MIKNNVSIVIAFLLFSLTSVAKEKPNILFIAVDDMRTELGCYDSPIAITPNIDRLAADGLLFKKAYCQQAICGPSRASIMTGIRPESSGIFHNYLKIRDVNPDIVTIPQYFDKNGYQSVKYGKIFHHGDIDPVSWSRKALETSPEKAYKGYAIEANNIRKVAMKKKMFDKYGPVAKYGLAMGPAYECADVEDSRYGDGQNADLAIETLRQFKKEGGKPFFLGLGFRKPHLNWLAPKKYWDLYDRENIDAAKQQVPPEGNCEMGIHASFELRVRDGIPKRGDIDPELARTLKHAYLACVSYVDAQVGRVVEELDRLGLKDNTIIILWSDHGWHLGEMGIWGKATNYEIATRVPLVLCTPDMPEKTKGVKTDAMVELVDIYPTLCDLAGLQVPENLEGHSFKPLLDKPKMDWKKAVFSQFPTPALREWGAYPLRPAMRETYFKPLIEDVEYRIIEQQGDKWDRDLFENNLMGYAMRSEKYKLIVWKNILKPEADPIYIELYDLRHKPTELKNIADKKPALVQKLLAQFNKGWKGNLPNSES